MVSRLCKLAARPWLKLSTRSEASPLKRKSFLSGRNPNSKRAARARFFFAQAGLDGSAPSYTRPEQDADTRATFPDRKAERQSAGACLILTTR